MSEFKSDFKRFIHFLRTPSQGIHCQNPYLGAMLDRDWTSFRFHTGVLLKWVFALLGFNVFVLSPIVMLVILNSPVESKITPELFQNSQNVLIAVLIAPFLEEMAFRYFLRRPSVAWWLVPLIMAAFLLGVNDLSRSLYGLTFILLLLHQRYGKINYVLARFWKKHLGVFFYLSVLVFGLMHLYNFSGQIGLLHVLLVLPQLSAGLVLGYIRMSYGIGASIFAHCVYNAIPVLLTVLFIQSF